MVSNVVELRPVKQVILVRRDLNMPAGKIGSQVAHASMAILLDLIRKNDVYKSSDDDVIVSNFRPVAQWINGSFTKICLGVDSAKEMETLYNTAKGFNIPVSKIVDDGRTIFGGVKTLTCCAIGPWWSNSIDEITGKLRLL